MKIFGVNIVVAVVFLAVGYFVAKKTNFNLPLLG